MIITPSPSTSKSDKNGESKSHLLVGKSLIVLLIVVSCLASVVDCLFFTAKFIKSYFGVIPLDQILINITTANSSNPELVYATIKAALPYIVKALLTLFFIWGLAIYFAFNRFWLCDFRQLICSIWRCLRKLVVTVCIQRPAVLFILAICILSFGALRYVDRYYHVISFFSARNSNFIEDNFAELDVNKVQFAEDNKRNLILIFLESMEYGYSDHRDYGHNLIPELKEIADNNVQIHGYKRTQGGYYTLDGISAQTLGVPLTQIPLDIHSGEGHKKYGVFLGGVHGIFNLLSHNGYTTAAFLGTSRNFTHKGDFLNVHGIQNVFSAETWDERKFPRDEQNRGCWDFNDSFVIERFKEYLGEISHGDQPFAITLETVDTHFPKGWAPYPKDFAKDGTYQDALQYSSKIIANLYEWMQRQPWFSSTTVIIVGDHPFQDANGVPFTSLSTKAQNREIFNAFINSVGSLRNRNCGFTAMDMAPTILNAMGVTFTSVFKGEESHSKMGLGRSLYSDDENLVCKYGQDELIRKLNERSLFYLNLHRRTE